MRRLFCLTAVFFACSAPAVAPPASRPAASVAPPGPDRSLRAVYRQSPEMVADRLARGSAVQLDDGHLGLAESPRVIVKGDTAIARAMDAPTKPMEQVVAVPARFGGGFVFATQDSLFWSESFLGALRPLRRAAVKSLMIGPHGVVADVGGQLRGIAIPSGQLTDVGVVGARRLGQDRDGSFVASLWNGHELRSVDSTTWNDVTPPDARERASMPASPPTPSTPGTPPTLTQAMAYGVNADGVAVVAGQEAIFGVDLTSGRVTARVPNPMPAHHLCPGVRHGEDVLFVCATGAPDYRPYVLRIPASLAGPPIIEHVFRKNGAVTASDTGDLAYAGSCDGEPEAPAVCVRTAEGAWVERSVDPALARRGIRWVPAGGDGDAVGLLFDGDAVGEELRLYPERAITQPQYRPLPGLGRVSAKTGAVTVWTKSVPVNRVDVGASPRIDSLWTLTPDGGLRGWQQAILRIQGAVEIDARGETTQLATEYEGTEFERISAHGAWAIARRASTFFESIDHGRSWTIVEPPPSTSAFTSEVCWAVGCSIDSWLRLGWTMSHAPVAQPPEPRRVADPPPLPTTRPKLVCEMTGAPRVSTPRLPNAAEDGENNMSPRQRFVSHYNPTAEATPLLWPGPTDLAYLMPFGPEGIVQRIQVPRRPRGSPNPYLPRGEIFRVTPAPDVRSEDLAYLGEHNMVVLRAGANAQLVARNPGGEMLSAVALPHGWAWLQDSFDHGLTSVVRQDDKTLFEVWTDVDDSYGAYTMAATLDALAVGHGGELAIVRVPGTGAMPDEVSPALLLRAGDSMTALAPWSSLATGKDCVTEPTWRTTFETHAPWVDLAASGLEPDAEVPTIARVRWGAAGVCLEAVELHARPREVADLDVTVVARFDDHPQAGLFVIGPDRAMRQPARCRLER